MVRGQLLHVGASFSSFVMYVNFASFLYKTSGDWLMKLTSSMTSRRKEYTDRKRWGQMGMLYAVYFL